MSKYLKQSKLLSFTYFILMLAASCENKEKKDEPGSSAVIENADVGKGKVMSSFTGGKLDTLYIGRAAFDTIQNAKIVFSFTFAGPDSLTMHGWLYKPGGGPHKEFDSLPNFKLANSKASNYTYGIETYFGNLILSSDVYAKLKIALNDAAIKYVVFAPYKLGNNIGYKICVTKDNMSIMSVMADVDPVPDSDLNPSPPKNNAN
jgi:hypothetical protein